MSDKPYAGKMMFHSDNYLSLSAIPLDEDPNNPTEDAPHFMIEWSDANEFAKKLRKAADFIDKHKDTNYFEVSID